MSQRASLQGFVGSAFSAQSKRLDCQDLWNWYVERAGSPYAKAGQVLLPCPGFETVVVLPTAPVRGLFAQNNRTFAVSGNVLYEVFSSGTYLARPTTALTAPSPAPVITNSALAPAIAVPTVPVVTHGGAKGTTTYGYKITATNAFGETNASGEGTSQLGNALLSGTNWNIISWSAVEDCTGYKVYRTTGPASSPALPVLLATLASTTLVYNDIGLGGTTTTPPTTNTTGQAVGATTYGYKITATLGLGESAASAEGTTTTGQATLSSTDYNIITWTAVINAHGYQVYRTTGNTGEGDVWLPPRLIATLDGTATLTVNDTGQEGEVLAPPTTTTTGLDDVEDDGSPVSWASSGDAGEQLFLVSGGYGYCYDLETNVFAPVVQGATFAGFIDSYFVALDAGTSTLKVSESFDGFHWDATQLYQRSRAGDKWLAMAVTSNEIWLIGSQTGEVWTGTGDADNRFSPYLPVFLETGIVATFSMTRVSGNTMMWVAADKDGAGYVVRTSGYDAQKVSTAAVDFSIQNLSVMADAYAFSYQQEGHVFWVVTFPNDSISWVYDLSTNEWHRRGDWVPNLRAYTAYRPSCHAFAFGGAGHGVNLVGDRASGVLARMDPSYGFDMGEVVTNETPAGLVNGSNTLFTTHTAYVSIAVYLNEIRQVLTTQYAETSSTTITFVTAPAVDDRVQVTYVETAPAVIRRLRQAPHITDRDQEMTFDRLQMDMEVGLGLATGQGSDPTMMIQYSNDFAKTWGHELWRSAGRQGDYRIQVAWSRLGTAKGRVFRLVVSDPIPWRIVGAWIEAEGS